MPAVIAQQTSGSRTSDWRQSAVSTVGMSRADVAESPLAKTVTS